MALKEYTVRTTIISKVRAYSGADAIETANAMIDRIDGPVTFSDDSSVEDITGCESELEWDTADEIA